MRQTNKDDISTPWVGGSVRYFYTILFDFGFGQVDGVLYVYVNWSVLIFSSNPWECS